MTLCWSKSGPGHHARDPPAGESEGKIDTTVSVTGSCSDPQPARRSHRVWRPGSGQGRRARHLNSPETPVFTKGRAHGLFEGRGVAQQGLCHGHRRLYGRGGPGSVGPGNAVATLGTACTAEHVQQLFRFTEQVVFSFDGDAARSRSRPRPGSRPAHATDARRISFLFLPREHDPTATSANSAPKPLRPASASKGRPAVPPDHRTCQRRLRPRHRQKAALACWPKRSC